MNQPAESAQPRANIELLAPVPGMASHLFPGPLLELLATLGRRYRSPVDRMLARRVEYQQRLDAGETPDFLTETRDIRESGWKVADIPRELIDRRVEITGPVDRKMIINALNSGARVFMADFEDSTTPTWQNLVSGQLNLYDASRRDIGYTAPDGREYCLGPNPAVLMVRPRGWHLDENHVDVDGKAVPGGIFDAAVFLYHNATTLIRQGSGPYLYLPKLENHREAELWERILADIEKSIGLAQGTIKVTVLIETISAVFEMDEILYALRGRVTGLNCGRWDYIFSYIKRFRAHADKVLPDRSQVVMTAPFLRAYSRLLIQTCHRRGAFAMGGMAAQIPIRHDPDKNARALAGVRADKQREANDGHDGTWVAHPGLVALAQDVFDEYLDGPNQRDRLLANFRVTAAELLEPVRGTISETGVRGNIEVALRYLAAWLDGRGCVPINDLMEDAATAEIARAQLWQWIRHPAGRLDDGRDIDLPMVRAWLQESFDQIRAQTGVEEFASGRFEEAAGLLDSVTAKDDFVEFITLPAYDRLLEFGA